MRGKERRGISDEVRFAIPRLIKTLEEFTDIMAIRRVGGGGKCHKKLERLGIRDEEGVEKKMDVRLG